MSTRSKSWSLTLELLSLLLLAAGCTAQTASAPVSSSTASSPTTSPPPKTVTPAKAMTATQPAINPVIQPATLPNLIPPTDDSKRLPQVDGVGDRADPFATLPVTPTVHRQPIPTFGANPAGPTQASHRPPAAGTARRTPPATVVAVPRRAPAQPQGAAHPAGTSPPLPSPPQVMPASPIASPPAQPSLAETIEISGILETTNHISVLVQVPNEATSRYVNVGDYIANGRVLVKRVEMGLEPIVVLEQDGREVIRSIGTI